MLPVDAKVEQISIATNSPSCNVKHLFKLFSLKISSIEPDLGIELFVIEAPHCGRTIVRNRKNSGRELRVSKTSSSRN